MRKITFMLTISLFVTGIVKAQNRFPATGRAGINTTNPAASLQVVGGTRIGTTTNYLNVDSATGNLSFAGTAGYRVANNQFAFVSAGAPAAGLFFNAASLRYEFRSTGGVSNLNIGADVNGRIGIGSGAPTEKVTVVDITNNNPYSGIMGVYANNLTQGVGIGYQGVTAIGSNTSQDLSLNAKNLGNITMQVSGSTGNVGIGTLTPTSKLTVAGTASITGDAIFSSRIGIGITPNAPLQLSNQVANRKIVLYQGPSNDHQFYGFGVNNLTLRYQVDTTAADHVFFAGASSSASAELFRIKGNGNVTLGGVAPATGYKLTIGGKVICTEVKVQLQPFPDYVFDKKYQLPTLAEVQDHINEFHRLPGMPSAAEVESNGMEVGKMQGKIVEKVEEATLYILQLYKENEQLKEQVKQLADKMAAMQQALANIKQ